MKKTRYFFFVLFVIVLVPASFTQTLRGKVTGSDGKQGIPFAVVVVDHSNHGTTCDLDGNFSLQLKGGEHSLGFQMLGYERKEIDLTQTDTGHFLLIKMKESGIGLTEIEVKAGEDPANLILRKVISGMSKHDIFNLPFYTCNTYAKTYFTMADKEGNENFYKKDSSKEGKGIKKRLDRSYLLFIESVSEKKYRYRNNYQEEILASRVSGFKSAPFGAFATQLQSFTFYGSNIELLGVKYLNPLSKGTFRRYKFKISDTLIAGTDTTIIIQFMPKKEVSFKAMKGLLYIYKGEYVLSKVIAEPAAREKNSNGIKVQQSYARTDKGVWFPDQLNTEILMNSIGSSKNMKSAIIKGVSKVYVRDVNLDSNFRMRNTGIEIYNASGFDKKSDEYWYEFRRDTLSSKEKQTYVVADSIGNKLNFDNKIKFFTSLLTAKYPVGYFDFDLRYLLRVNQYENTRVGLGIATNNKVSRWFSLGAFGGYGFKDHSFKYGGMLKLFLSPNQHQYLQFDLARDLEESAGTFFYDDYGSIFSTQKFRDLLVTRMDKVDFAKASLNFRPFPTFKMAFFGQVQQRQSDFGYRMSDSLNSPLLTNFTMNTAGVQFCYRPGEKFIETMGQWLSKGSAWPVLYLNLTKSLSDQIDEYKSQFDFTRVDLRIDHVMKFKIKGYFAWQVQAGKVWGECPYSWLYNNKGSRSGQFSISAERSFETMFMNEFVSNEYAAAFVCIGSGQLFRTGADFNPEIEWVYNYGIGNFYKKERMTNVELNDMSKGFTESGIRLKNLYRAGFSSLGLGVFYRYGNYAYERMKDNLVFKFVLTFTP